MRCKEQEPCTCLARRHVGRLLLRGPQRRRLLAVWPVLQRTVPQPVTQPWGQLLLGRAAPAPRAKVDCPGRIGTCNSEGRIRILWTRSVMQRQIDVLRDVWTGCRACSHNC